MSKKSPKNTSFRRPFQKSGSCYSCKVGELFCINAKDLEREVTKACTVDCPAYWSVCMDLFSSGALLRYLSNESALYNVSLSATDKHIHTSTFFYI